MKKIAYLIILPLLISLSTLAYAGDGYLIRLQNNTNYPLTISKTYASCVNNPGPELWGQTVLAKKSSNDGAYKYIEFVYDWGQCASQGLSYTFTNASSKKEIGNITLYDSHATPRDGGVTLETSAHTSNVSLQFDKQDASGHKWKYYTINVTP